VTVPLLLDAVELQGLLARDGVRVFDCRFDLADRERGRELWLDEHVPGAAYADLDRDLAGPVTDRTGRHPLPSADAFAAFLARSGWREGMPVVAYDAQGGAFAARLWWLMRSFGQDVVSLLDGGWPAWKAAGGAVASGEERFEATPPPRLRPKPAMVQVADGLLAAVERGDVTLLDARDGARYAGRNETIDPVAGHVPGALNRPFPENLDEAGRFRDSATLRGEFDALLGDRPPEEVVHMCGSGVTACHNLFAMERAGLTGSRLYVGSWSHWIRDPDRPVATGPNP